MQLKVRHYPLQIHLTTYHADKFLNRLQSNDSQVFIDVSDIQYIQPRYNQMLTPCNNVFTKHTNEWVGIRNGEYVLTSVSYTDVPDVVPSVVYGKDLLIVYKHGS